MRQLPQEFMCRMQDMLKEAYPAFLRSYEEEKVQALRVNALKGTREEFLEKAKEMGYTQEQFKTSPVGKGRTILYGN